MRYGAGVTDSTNVAAAGAVLDGDLFQRIYEAALVLEHIPLINTYLTSYTETDPVVGAVNGIVKANGVGTISAATAGTDWCSHQLVTVLD